MIVSEEADRATVRFGPVNVLPSFGPGGDDIELFPERAELIRLLAETKGKLRKAARLAGMDSKNFSDKVKKYNLSLEEFTS